MIVVEDEKAEDMRGEISAVISEAECFVACEVSVDLMGDLTLLPEIA